LATLIFFILVFLILSAFFSGSEIAFVSANKLGIEIKRNQGSAKGKVLARFYDNPKSFLSTMLVGNNVALVVFTMLMGSLMRPFFNQLVASEFGLLVIETLITTIVVLILGEFLPKTLFRLYANQLMYILTYPLLFFKWLLLLPTWVMTKASEFVIKNIFRASFEDGDKSINRLDLEHFFNDRVSEKIEDIDRTIFTNVLNLNQIKVRNCMIPRTEIIALDQHATIDELIDTIYESNHSRILVIDGDIENVLGYIHHQQLFEKHENIKELILEIPFVPEAMNAQDLLLRFINHGTNIACVVDEYGGTAGIITLEDILEEIFGEIEDEHDQEEYIEKKISNTEYLFSGRLEIDYINEKYENIYLPEGEYDTLSGYLVMTSGSIPESDAVIELDGYRFILEMVGDKKIETIRIIKLQDA
jgi:CBS domain containing-hemolysin-like protein